jgi:peptide/nickel transport system substrate-binding protein
MKFHTLKLRFRRKFRKSQRRVEDFGELAEEQFEKTFIRRFERLTNVRRFVIGWIALFLLLIGSTVAELQGLGNSYQTVEPVPGGNYTEGIIGSFTTANPLYATTQADTSVSHLVFSGLFTYDENNNLVGSLAEDWTVDDSGKTYKVRLKPNLTWHDGRPLTAKDVEFTYNLIQNPDSRSPLLASWKGIEVKRVDDRTVTFTIPTPLSSFPYSLTNGIVPEHVLKKVPIADLRSSSFNTQFPVGAGPFKWKEIEVSGTDARDSEELIELAPFDKYHAGAPKLNSFVIHTYNDEASMIKSFEQQELNGMIGLSAVPPKLAESDNSVVHSFIETAARMAFFNTQQAPLNETSVRQALVQATDVPAVLKSLDYVTRPVNEPLLNNQLGYNSNYKQLAYNPGDAAKKLDEAGWAKDDHGKRRKDGKPLEINLAGADSSENKRVAKTLKSQWGKVGIKLNVKLMSDQEFRTLLANPTRDYQVILHGISIGVDPDVFVYWHSSQTDPRSTRLNFSQYKSKTVDTALETGRTRTDPRLRAAKYEPFLKTWQQDAPAVGLYQPRLLYVTSGTVFGLEDHMINHDTDRFSNVHNWMIREARVTKSR